MNTQVPAAGDEGDVGVGEEARLREAERVPAGWTGEQLLERVHELHHGVPEAAVWKLHHKRGRVDWCVSGLPHVFRMGFWKTHARWFFLNNG